MIRKLTVLVAVFTLAVSGCAGNDGYVEYNPGNAPTATVEITPSCR